jgi:hypothetical protein
MTTTIDNVTLALRGLGYKVSLSPHEKIELKEIVITLEGIDIETETSGSYFLTYTYALNFMSNSIVDIATNIPIFINTIDKAAVGTAPDFQSVTPEITKQDGTLYLVAMKFTFKDTLVIT